jgi:hypothetical protein
LVRRNIELSCEDVDILSNIVLRLGAYAKKLFDRFDLGISRSRFTWHVDEVYRNLLGLRDVNGGRQVFLAPPGTNDSFLVQNPSDTWNYTQTLRFAAGATMISQKYLRSMSPENLRNSMIAKILYKCQTGILDDLIDTEKYSYIDAKNLYHHVLSSMIDPDFEPNTYKKKLMSMLKEDQLHLFDLMVDITSSFNKVFSESPQGQELFYRIEVLDERVTLGQALSMFQKEGYLDTNRIESISSKFYAPSDDLRWFDRLANYVSGGTRYNLIDLSFCEGVVDLNRVDTLLEGWYYYDMVIVYLNNVVHIYEDLKEGIANLSLVSLREDEISDLSTLEGYNPRLTIDDYTNHLSRLAGYSSRALEIMTREHDDALYYPFITIMMPVVMMADWIGKQDSLIGFYLNELSPALREAASEIETSIPESAEAAA